jgi:hypothetical protein
MTNVSLTTVPSVVPQSCGKHGVVVIRARMVWLLPLRD